MTAGVDPFYERVARVALGVAGRYGFVLGGGLALILHGALQRPTEDIDLFGPESASVPTAAAEVRAALGEAGIRTAEVRHDSELDEVIEGLAYFMAEMIAYPGPGSDGSVRLSLGHLNRTLSPVVLDVGPAMAMPDLIASKVAALVNRAEERDFVDVAAFLEEYDSDTLLAMARRADPALEEEDVARAGRRLDRTPDAAFARYGLDAEQAARLRERFSGWPR